MNYKTMYTTNRIINSASISPDQLIKHVTQRQSELISLIKYINLQQNDAPSGSLRITKRGNSHQYYHRIDSKDICGTYIRKSQLNLAKGLAQKDYNSRIMHEIKSELHAIDNFFFTIIQIKSNTYITRWPRPEKDLLILYFFQINHLKKSGNPLNMNLSILQVMLLIFTQTMVNLSAPNQK